MRRYCGALVIASLAALNALANNPKNVILMISDGASWGTWDMASFYQYGAKGQQSYDQFSVKLGMTTYPLNTSTVPTYTGTPQISYDPAQAWSTTPVGPPHYFAGYQYIKQNYTDSAAAGTALATGIKTYNNAINYDDFGQPVPFITQIAKAFGKATGVVSSVPWTHATPAAFGAQNVSRNNYAAIGAQMINETTLDLIMGGGNPDYDNNGQPRSTPNYQFIGSATWSALKNGTAGGSRPWTLIESKADFQSLANGTVPNVDRLVGTAQVAATLQFNRSGSGMGNLVQNVPSLVDMSKGALNFLKAKGGNNGFFVMIEGGAVDWAAHANNTGRIIEEQVDFNLSVDAVVEWILNNGGWDENLLIVTTDHGNGMPMGPNSDTNAFEKILNNGAGNLPGVRWHYNTHTNEVVYLFAHGAGSDVLYDYVRGIDPGLRDILEFNDGRYIDNTDVFYGLQRVIPEPASLLLVLLGLGALARRRSA